SCANICGTAALPKIEVEGIVFPSVAKPPGSSKTLFLGGAGSRGLEVGGRFINFRAIGIYLEDDAIQSLSGKWRGKTGDELAGSPDFFRDIFAGLFEKFTRVVMIQPLAGQQYSEKVAENCIAIWKAAAGNYTKAEAVAIEKFEEAFKDETFPHGSSILFTHSLSGSLTIAFSKEKSFPGAGRAVIENKAPCETVLETIIREHGVSPEARRSLALRLSELLKGS
ncbi:Chalcone--flavonone isomerase, partial [Cocos nucifera]